MDSILIYSQHKLEILRKYTVPNIQSAIFPWYEECELEAYLKCGLGINKLVVDCLY